LTEIKKDCGFAWFISTSDTIMATAATIRLLSDLKQISSEPPEVSVGNLV
jgi:hypothetical protein